MPHKINKYSPIKFEDQKPEFDQSIERNEKSSERVDLRSDSAISDGRKSPTTRRLKKAYRLNRSQASQDIGNRREMPTLRTFR